MSDAEEIKARLNIVEYIQQCGVPLKKSGRYYKSLCPFHTENTPSFIVNDEKQTWKCFGACAKGGDIFEFAMKRHGWAFPEALRELGKLAGVEVTAPPENHEEQKRLRELLETAAEAYHLYLCSHKDDARQARQYLLGRGLTGETLGVWQIGYVPQGWDQLLQHLTDKRYTPEEGIKAGVLTDNHKGRIYDRFRNRIMIPIRDARGRIAGFGGRILNAEDQPKYLNTPRTPVFDKSHLLFGLDRARDAIRQSETVVVVEGYMDVLQAHQAGFHNVVAQMGTALTEAQIKQITSPSRRIVLALDADPAGQNATRRSLEVARTVLQRDWQGRLMADIRIAQLPEGYDPDDLLRIDPAHWRACLAEALPLVDYVIEQEMKTLPASRTVQDRQGVARRLLPLLNRTEDNLLRQDNLQKLALRLRFSELDLIQWAKEQSVPATAPSRPEVAQVPQGSPMPPIEKMVLAGLLQHESWYYSAGRALRLLAGGNETFYRYGLDCIVPQDFSHTELRQLFELFLASQDDTTFEYVALEHVRRNMDESLQPALEEVLTETLGETRYVLQVMTLRLQRVQEHLEALVGTGEDAGLWLKAKARLREGLLQHA